MVAKNTNDLLAAARFEVTVAVDDVESLVPRGSAFGYLGLRLSRPEQRGQDHLDPHPARPDQSQRRHHGAARHPAPGPAGHRPGPGRPGRKAGDKVATYSMGMRQRLGVAACLLADPELLMLDEPMNGLDPAGMHQMRAMIASLADEGRTVMLSSHLLDEVQRTRDPVAIVDHGRVIRQGPIDELIRGAGALVVQVDCAEPAGPNSSSRTATRPGSGRPAELTGVPESTLGTAATPLGWQNRVPGRARLRVAHRPAHDHGHRADRLRDHRHPRCWPVASCRTSLTASG
jgi:hypothetical protein